MSNSEFKITISPAGSSQREVSQTNRDLYESLGRRMRHAGKLDEARALKLVSQDRSAQDFGAVIIAVLAAPAVIEMVKGIADFLKTLAPKDRRIIVEKNSTKIDLVNPSVEELNRAFQSFDDQ